MNKKYDILPALFWIGLSIFVMIFSYRLELGDFQDPGPGLMPFLVGIALFLASIFIVIKYFSKGQEANDIVKGPVSSRIKIYKVGTVLGSLFTYAILLERLGYLVTTSLLLIFLFKIAGSPKWRSILIASILTVIITFLVFTLLGLRFPKGIFKG